MITEGRRRCAISLDHKVRVIDDLPRRLQRNRQDETPTDRHSTNEKRQQSAEHQPMQDVCKAIGVEKGLRCLGTPGIAGPQKHAARAPPKTCLTMKLPRGSRQDKNDSQQWPEISLVQRQQ